MLAVLLLASLVPVGQFWMIMFNVVGAVLLAAILTAPLLSLARLLLQALKQRQ